MMVGCKEDHISPTFFTACLDRVLRNLEWVKSGMRVHGENLNHLKFAADIFLQPTADLQPTIRSTRAKRLEELQLQSCPIGLKMNMTKSEVMLIRSGESLTFSAGNKILDLKRRNNIPILDEFLVLIQTRKSKSCVQSPWPGEN